MANRLNCQPLETLMAGKITIGGRTFSGNSISIQNGKVTIDGVVQDGVLSGVVEIRVVEGILGQLTCDGSVTCGDVRGDVDAGGSVDCKHVGGNVDAGGSVTCGNVSGAVDAGGSVRMGR
jgi:hypothetical protein